ncbi:MAG: EAL domain-containing protein [Myxococcota bacterium]
MNDVSVLHLDAWQNAIAAVRNVGYRLALDDLGAGYNSLSLLAELDPAFIKIDMSIVRNIDTSAAKQRLVELLVRFAAVSECGLIAEGVETENEAKVLIEAGAPLLQGYHFGRPSLNVF